MQSRTCLFSAFTLSVAMVFGAAALAADLPKEGTFSGTYSGFGTFKATLVGKERVVAVWDANAITVGKGIWDHVSWHGSGQDNITSGISHVRGYFVGTDSDGDNIVVDLPEVTHPAGKAFNGTLLLTSGTGKYAGISGSFKSVCDNGFRTAEGTFAESCANEGSYKLP
jgi:hypothetical protein